MLFWVRIKCHYQATPYPPTMTRHTAMPSHHTYFLLRYFKLTSSFPRWVSGPSKKLSGAYCTSRELCPVGRGVQNNVNRLNRPNQPKRPVWFSFFSQRCGSVIYKTVFFGSVYSSREWIYQKTETTAISFNLAQHISHQQPKHKVSFPHSIFIQILSKP